MDKKIISAELTRLGNTLRQVGGLHWILVEDASAPSPLLTNFLNTFPQVRYPSNVSQS